MRGTGRTTKQLDEAYQRALEGVSTLFVCGHCQEANYAVGLLCSIAKSGKASRASMQVNVGGAVIRCVPRTRHPECGRAWRGVIVFDHNAAPDTGGSDQEWSQWREWLAVASHVNSRLENSTPNFEEGSIDAD